MGKRRTKEQMRLDRERDWAYLGNYGFSQSSVCGWCRDFKPCRCARRGRWACHDCYVTKGPPAKMVAQ